MLASYAFNGSRVLHHLSGDKLSFSFQCVKDFKPLTTRDSALLQKQLKPSKKNKTGTVIHVGTRYSQNK